MNSKSKTNNYSVALIVVEQKNVPTMCLGTGRRAVSAGSGLVHIDSGNVDLAAEISFKLP